MQASKQGKGAGSERDEVRLGMGSWDWGIETGIGMIVEGAKRRYRQMER